MKVVENSPQIIQNCTIFKNFLGEGGMPSNPPSNGSQLRHVHPKSPKFYSCTPTPREILHTPLINNLAMEQQNKNPLQWKFPQRSQLSVAATK